MDPQVIDRIYESSFVPELWPGVLTELAKGHFEKYSLEAGRSAIEVAAVSV
jgi:hypothetical protein